MESDLCCVCGVHLERKQRRVLEQSTNIISLICEWIAPRIISENDYICQVCYKCIMQNFIDSKANKIKETNEGLDMEVFENAEQSSKGKCSKTADRNVCLMCDTPLSTRRSLLIIKHDPTELDQLMLNLISEAISPEIKIGNEDKVCSKCWFKVKRSAINLQQINKLEPNGSRDEDQSVVIKSESSSDQEYSEYLMQIEEIEVQLSELIESDPEHVDVDDLQNDPTNYNSDFTIKPPVNDKKQKNNGYEYLSDLDPQINELKDDPKDPDFTVTTRLVKKIQKQSTNEKKKENIHGTEINPLISDNIVLPSYKRVGSSNARCLFPKCKNTQTKLICNEIRAKLIKDYKLYIPQIARMCKVHFLSNSWNTLQENDWSYLKFNANHIEDMFSMVQEKKGIEIDFSDILKLDDSIIKYLLGTTRDILASILTREPQILTRTNGLKGLLALFIRHENGSSYTRISDLLKIPTKTMYSAMRNVQKILSESPMTKELGLENILLVRCYNKVEF